MKTIYSHEYRGEGGDPSPLSQAELAPPWRRLERAAAESIANDRPPQPRPISRRQALRAQAYFAGEHEARMVDAAIVLRRPLLITGHAGVGKTSLAYSVAWQLGLGNVLRWNITSRSTLKDALYQYDAVSRLHDVSLRDKAKGDPDRVGDYITLGPLGTALLPSETQSYFPRVLLIDELDKADADLPSDLLHVLEEGMFKIDEIERHTRRDEQSGKRGDSSDSIQVRTIEGTPVDVPADGVIRANDFPLIMMTNNNERDFPPAFRRRCLPLEIHRPSGAKLRAIVQTYLGDAAQENEIVKEIITAFDSEKDKLRATDQLLNALQLVMSLDLEQDQWNELNENILRSIDEVPSLDEPSRGFGGGANE